MPGWVIRLISGLLLASLVSPLAAVAQSGPVAEIRIIGAVDEVIEQGQNLEQQRRWGDALSHYEDALRQYPGDRRLEQRLTVSRLHYDVARRYHDNSFRQAVRGLSHAEALSLYGEVLLKIQSHFVEPPDWQLLADRGTTSLQVALHEPLFLQNNLPDLSPADTDEFTRQLRALAASQRIQDRHAARAFADRAGQLAQEKLGLSPTAVVLEYTCGATHGLDDYSAYLTADQLNDVYAQIDGNFVGLGIELKSNDRGLAIVKVIMGSPAEEAGLRAGDRIVEVDGRPTGDLSTDEAADLLQGTEGSTVELVLLDPRGQSRHVRVRRRQVEVPSIDNARLIDRERGIAYLRLAAFQKSTTRDLDAALWRLHRDGMRSLIIDLRGNPGGLLSASVEVADKFVSSGTIVSTRGRNPSEDFNYSAHRSGTWRVPLVVLIDGDSASASEIFAGAIRDHRRGTIVGTRSYGKGSVQGIFPLNVAHAGLRLTTARFYSPSGHPYTRVGVTPDVVVHETARPLEGGQISGGDEDPALAAALREARQQLARR